MWPNNNTFLDVCLEHVPLSNLQAEGPPNGKSAGTNGYLWFEKLIIWVLLCGATYVLISLLRRFCKAGSDQPYTVIADEDEPLARTSMRL